MFEKFLYTVLIYPEYIFVHVFSLSAIAGNVISAFYSEEY